MSFARTIMTGRQTDRASSVPFCCAGKITEGVSCRSSSARGMRLFAYMKRKWACRQGRFGQINDDGFPVALPFLKATDWLFDAVTLRIVPRMNYWSDGVHGQRVLFVTDENETFIVSFEEGTEYPDYRHLPGYICAEHQIGNFCLRQCRGEQKEALNNVCVFQIEWTDRNGIVHIQPGQMVTGSDYIWADGVEPLLLSFIASLQEPCSA